MKQTIKLTESKLRDIVESTVREVLQENLFTSIGNKVNNGFNALRDKLEDTAQGYSTLEGNPQSERDVFKGNGWIVTKEEDMPNGKTFEVKRTSGAFGNFYGKDIEELIEDMNIFLNKKGTIKYIGKSNGNNEKFEIKYF